MCHGEPSNQAFILPVNDHICRAESLLKSLWLGDIPDSSVMQCPELSTPHLQIHRFPPLFHRFPNLLHSPAKMRPEPSHLCCILNILLINDLPHHCLISPSFQEDSFLCRMCLTAFLAHYPLFTLNPGPTGMQSMILVGLIPASPHSLSLEMAASCPPVGARRTSWPFSSTCLNPLHPLE